MTLPGALTLPFIKLITLDSVWSSSSFLPSLHNSTQDCSCTSPSPTKIKRVTYSHSFSVEPILLWLLWRLHDLFALRLMKRTSNGLFKNILTRKQSLLTYWCREVVPSGPGISRKVCFFLLRLLWSSAAAVITLRSWLVPCEWTFWIEFCLVWRVKLCLLSRAPENYLWGCMLWLHILGYRCCCCLSQVGLWLSNFLWLELSLSLCYVDHTSFPFFSPIFANRALVLFLSLKLANWFNRPIRS